MKEVKLWKHKSVIAKKQEEISGDKSNFAKELS